MVLTVVRQIYKQKVVVSEQKSLRTPDREREKKREVEREKKKRQRVDLVRFCFSHFSGCLCHFHFSLSLAKPEIVALEFPTNEKPTSKLSQDRLFFTGTKLGENLTTKTTDIYLTLYPKNLISR